MAELPKLGYEYDALEPYIDARTMEIHHSKHHKAYVDKYNAAIKGHSDLEEKDAEEVIANLNDVPEEIRTAVRNNGGGVVNHSFFWKILKKDVEPKGEIIEAIKEEFGSFEKFKDEFSNAAATLFGSGWAWLVLDNGKLKVITTKNQDSPLTIGKIPLIALDVWEHAYYLKYQNRRPEYIEAFFSVINWDVVNDFFLKAKEA
ncbi:superoxide dismutase [Candidatus Woesearchaeota archaeon]|nr:MAG: superoxide dismutase [Candidatus Woesearchaeota archaeon]